MSILSIQPFQPVGAVGVVPYWISIFTNDNTATILTAGYLNAGKQYFGFQFSDYQMALVYTTDGLQICEVSVNTTTGDVTLSSAINPGTVVLPVVSGDFSVFSGTTGKMYDAGYSPSDATKTKVVMLNAASTIGQVAVFTDVAGTIGGVSAAVTLRTNVTGTTQAIVNDTVYTNNSSGTAAFSLPATAAIGTTFEIIGNAAGGWTISQGAGQTILVGANTTTTGVGGSVASTDAGDCAKFTCVEANLTWRGSAVEGNLDLT